MFEAFQIHLSPGELLKRTVKETIDDDGLGLAAQLAYYFFLALFPAVAQRGNRARVSLRESPG
jgi:hypothetical protein